MTSRSNLFATRWILTAALTFGATVVQAASGITILANQETAIKIGMSTPEVEQILGRPARIANYRSAPGPTWTYHVIGSPFGMTDFDVGFGPDGKVASAGELVLGSR